MLLLPLRLAMLAYWGVGKWRIQQLAIIVSLFLLFVYLTALACLTTLVCQNED